MCRGNDFTVQWKVVSRQQAPPMRAYGLAENGVAGRPTAMEHCTWKWKQLSLVRELVLIGKTASGRHNPKNDVASTSERRRPNTITLCCIKRKRATEYARKVVFLQLKLLIALVFG